MFANYRDFYAEIFASPIRVDELTARHFPDYNYFDRIVNVGVTQNKMEESNNIVVENLLFNDYILNNSPYAYINSRCAKFQYAQLPESTKEPLKLSINSKYDTDSINKSIYNTCKNGLYELEEKFFFDKNCMLATDVILADNSQVDITADLSGIHTTQTSINYFFVLNKHSKLNFFILGLGSGKLFINIYAIINGVGAEVKIRGCCLSKGNDDAVIVSYINHKAPKNMSSVHINNVLLDRAKNFFLGLIKVDKRGEEIDALETNRNLLLSKEARTLSIPKLEIENNNLRCSHASSISSVDEDILFYLNSRGIEYRDAIKLTAMGFLVEPFTKRNYDGLIEDCLNKSLLSFQKIVN